MRLSYGLWYPASSHGVSRAVYKARERIHRGMLIRDY